MFGKYTCVRVQFLRWSKSNLKTKIEWRTKHWTIVADLLILVGLLLIKDDSVREASTGADPDSKVRGSNFRNIW